METRNITIIHFSGDWAVAVDRNGDMIDQGHWSDLQERVLAAVGIGMEWEGKTPMDRMKDNGRHFDKGANFKDYL